MLAIELEPKSMEPATAPEAQYETKQLLQVKSICAHFCHAYAPTLPRFSWDYKALKLVVALMALFTIYPLKNIKIQYTHIVMICTLSTSKAGKGVA